MRAKRSLVVVLLALGVAWAVLAGPPADGEAVAPRREGRPFKHHELIEPIYPWRVPGYGGKLKLLILSHSWVTAEFAEFAKRFDFDYDLVPIWSENLLKRSHRTAGSMVIWNRITRLLDDNDYNCILVTSYGNFPAFVWAAIYRECIEKGAGLILVNTGNPWSGMPKQIAADGFITPQDHLKAVPFAGVDWTGGYEEAVDVDPKTQMLLGFKTEEHSLRGPNVWFATNKGKARVAAFGWDRKGYSYWGTYHGPTPAGLWFPFGRVYPMADHLFAIVGKAVMWTSHREPRIRIARIVPGESKLTPAARDKLGYTIVIRTERDQVEDVVVDWEVVDEGGRRLAGDKRLVSVGPKGADAMAPLGPLPGVGQHLYLRARLLRNENVLDWGTSHVEITYPRDTWTFTVADGTLHDETKPLIARIELKGNERADALRVDLIDSWNRTVRSVQTKPTGRVTQIPVPLTDALGLAFRLRAVELRAGRVVGQKETFCTLERIPQHKYWGIRSTSATSTPTGWYLTHLNRLYGMNFYRTRGAPLFANTLRGFAFGVYSYYGRITGPIAPDLSATYRDFIDKDVLTVKAYAASLYDFGDDTGVGKGLFHSRARTKELRQAEEDQDWARFLAYLKTVYKTHAELSDSWAVKLGKWEDASRQHIIDEQKKKNMVPLLDYRQYQEHLYAGHLRHMREILRKELPWAKTTLNAWGNIGENMPILAAELDGMVPYYRPYTLRKVRGILGRDKMLGFVTGAYYGENTNRRFLSFIPWETVLLGGNVVWVWGTGCIDRDGGFSDPTYPIFESARQIGLGLGELLANASWDNEGVFILLSPASNHAQEMGPKLGMANNSGETFCAVLEELQTGYDYIASADVAAGALMARKARVLFLPYSVGMTPAVQQRVREFVQAGGIVVADFRPATRTPRGRPLAQGGLDDLFGVSARTMADPVGHGALPGTDLATMVDRATVARDAKVGGRVGDAPILLARTQGKGRTLLFNCFVGKYRTLLSAGRGDSMTEWMSKALADTGVPVRGFGRQPAGTKVFRYRRAGIEYLAVSRSDIPGTPERVKLTLPLGAVRHVYNVRGGGSLGRMDRLVIDVGKQEAHVFALSPAPLAPFEAVIGAETVRPGEAAVLSIDSGRAGAERLLRLDVEDASGNPYTITGRLHWTRGGRCEIRWATALEDPPGLYYLTLTDIDTGQTIKAAVRVAGAPVIESKGGAQ